MSNSKLRLGPGIRVLDTQLRSIAEFETWRHSVLYNLRLDGEFKEYLVPGYRFGKKSNASPVRELKPSGTGDAVKTAEAKCSEVDMMLSQISQFCPIIPHNDIIRDCATLDEVWQVIRLHSNIETTAALLNDCWNISRKPEETPQALYSRLKQAYDDSLIHKNTLIYRSAVTINDEEMSPTLHSTVILHWLQILHPKLRDLVTQRFSVELRKSSYVALFPDISRCVDSLLRELQDDANVCRFGEMSVRPSSRFGESFSRPSSARARGSYSRPRNYPRSAPSNLQCEYCRLMGRRAFNTHTITDCIHISREKQKSDQAFTKAVETDEYYEDQYDEYYDDSSYASNCQVTAEHYINRVSLHASPTLTLYHEGSPFDVTCDTGGTASVVPSRTAKSMNCKIRATNQRARMADGVSNLNVIGETDVKLYRDGKCFHLNALVCDMSEETILAGMPFMRENDIAIRPAKAEIIIDGKDIITYNPRCGGQNKTRRVHSYTVQSRSYEVLLPGQSYTYQLPAPFRDEDTVAIDPRLDSSHNRLNISVWPEPKVVKVSEDGSITLDNATKDPVIIKKHEHICNVQAPTTADHLSPELVSDYLLISQVSTPPPKKVSDYSRLVQVDPDNILNPEERRKFREVLHMYDEVFNPSISRYNGKAGVCYVEVNMGPHPPAQFKGKVPFYGRDNLVQLQEKFDALAAKGVFRRPQDIGITVENVNPSFLVKKRSSQDMRLVTDFGSIAPYCRPTPTVMPDVDTVLRQISSWQNLIKTDLTEAYHQLELKRSSMKYCGVSTPMKGNLVYTVGCMGLPGTEVALEELTSLLFGDMVKAGKVAKLADDLYIGGDTLQELRNNFERVLGILLENNIKLKAQKTVIVPKSTEILGWIWSGGVIKASSHKLSGLTECKPPETVSGLKSFIGAYRFLSRVIKAYASLLSPLDDMLSGKSSGSTKLTWSDERVADFKKAQDALRSPKAISVPRPDDTLWIITDAALNPTAIAATLYAIRGKETLLAGFYNAKLPVFQRRWLPCEIEGVAIGAALKHYSPYILQSNHKPCVLTDSKACIQAVEKLQRGQYSSSARLCTFLSYVSRYQAIVKHISGAGNVTSDFISRNPVTCNDKRCQICKFLEESTSSVVASISVDDVLSGSVHLPYVNKKAWIEVQSECPDLKSVVKYLRNGTTPGKKGRNLRLVRRYISSKVVLSPEGTLVVRHVEPLQPVRERIVVPQQVLYGVLAALHLRLNHPTNHQMHKVFQRYFFALNVEDALKRTSEFCHQCSALKDIPKALKHQSTNPSPDVIGNLYAADIIKRYGQSILVLRECVSSYTLADIIINETVPEVAQGLVRLCSVMRPSQIIPITIRVDPAAAHRSLFEDTRKNSILKAQNINLELGRVMNKDKNPVAEKAIRELGREILLLSPDGVQVSSTILACSVANLNSRVRASGLSAHETFTQRDQNTGEQLPIDDQVLIISQHKRRVDNHQHSERSKAGNKPPHPVADLSIGSLVYRYDDGSKVKARPKYIVIARDGKIIYLKRFASKQLSKEVYEAKVDEVYKISSEMDFDFHKGTPDDTKELDEELILHTQPKYPCSVCRKDVHSTDQALLCDHCSMWCHRTCGEVSADVYNELSTDSSFPWSCPSHVLSDTQESDEEPLPGMPPDEVIPPVVPPDEVIPPVVPPDEVFIPAEPPDNEDQQEPRRRLRNNPVPTNRYAPACKLIREWYLQNL